MTLAAWLLIAVILAANCWDIVAQEKTRATFEDVISAVKALRAAGTSAREIPGLKTIKCGLGVILEAKDQWNDLSAAQQRELSAILAPPATQKNRIIGHFNVFYDTAGVHTPALLDNAHVPIPGTAERYVDSVGKYFNVAWDVEVDTLGYDAPPFLQGDSHYNVYIREENQYLYGLTMPVSIINQANPPLYDSYIEIDNDYLGFYSEGIAGLKVTSAHEFHHAIQLGRYGYWSTDRYFLEITSTWMEDVVHTEVNDYYQYLSNSVDQISQFSYPGMKFTLDNNSIEYSRAIWGKFVEQRYSRDVMHATWNYIRQINALNALDRALKDYGSSFRQAFIEWSLWNMNTGPNADTTNYFYTEGRAYPPMRMNPVTGFTSGQRTMSGSTDVMSSQYYPLLIYSPAGDSSRLNAMITNVNMNPAAAAQSYSYIIADNGDDSYRHLSIGLYAKLIVSDPVNWAVQEVIIDTSKHIRTVPEVVPDIVVYPNPFIATGSAKLIFHLPSVSVSDADMTILSSSLDRVISRKMPIVELKPSEPYLVWDGHDEGGSIVATGVYFYFITVGDRQYMGKVAIIRE